MEDLINKNMMLPPGIYDHTHAVGGGAVVGKLQIGVPPPALSALHQQQQQQQQQQQRLAASGIIGNGSIDMSVAAANGGQAMFLGDDGRPPPPPPHASLLHNVVAGEIGRAEELVTVITEQEIEQSLDCSSTTELHDSNADASLTTPSTSIVYNGNN